MQVFRTLERGGRGRELINLIKMCDLDLGRALSQIRPKYVLNISQMHPKTIQDIFRTYLGHIKDIINPKSKLLLLLYLRHLGHDLPYIKKLLDFEKRMRRMKNQQKASEGKAGRCFEYGQGEAMSHKSHIVNSALIPKTVEKLALLASERPKSTDFKAFSSQFKPFWLTNNVKKVN